MTTLEVYTQGTVVELFADLTSTTGADVDALAVDWRVTDPTGHETAYSLTSGVSHDGVGHYHLNVPGTMTGIWRWRVLTDGTVVAAEGAFEIQSIYLGGVTDSRDLRTLIPACRRAIDGPMATTPTAPSTTLDDQQVLALIADSVGTLILQSQGNAAFGYQLIPTARDPFYKAPVAWATDTERVPAADAAILSQAALDHYFWLIRLMKVSETMKNEAVEWEYSLSANVIAAWMQYLIANRDKAIAALQVINAPMDVYISLVAERDRMAAAWLEPWVSEVGAVVPYAGGGGSGPIDFDWRFGTYG